MALLPRSPRTRRRLGWAAALAAAVAAVALAVVALPRAERAPETAVVGGETSSARQAPLRLTPARRAEIDRLVRAFTASAVTRADPEAAWALASSSMRRGVSRETWARGDLPGVTPFPAGAVKDVSWSVAYRAPGRVGLDVLVVARPAAGRRSIVYQVDLVLEDDRLLVETWTPETTLTAGGATPPAPAGEPGPTFYDKGRLDPRWLLVPAGIVLALLATAALLLVRQVVRSRRAYRRYRRHAGA